MSESEQVFESDGRWRDGGVAATRDRWRSWGRAGGVRQRRERRRLTGWRFNVGGGDGGVVLKLVFRFSEGWR
jgi:hypothetical protein